MRSNSLIALASATATAAVFGGLALIGPGHAAATHNAMMGGSTKTGVGSSMIGERVGPRMLRVLRPEKGAGAQVTHVRLMKGEVMRRMRATVMTDTRCGPDARGISHCINRMQLANGRMVTAIHDHRMMDMPCLSPGEHVTVAPS